jgi:hypothetical protein
MVLLVNDYVSTRGGPLHFMAPFITLMEMGEFSMYYAGPSLTLLSLQFLTYRTPEICCSLGWALRLLALL